MVTATEIYELQETFYVPFFQIKILPANLQADPNTGQKLPDDIIHDVMQVTYKDNVKEIDSFELTIANWDSSKFMPKYEPYSDPRYKGKFDPGQRIGLYMGYLNNQRLMMTGEITTLEPSYQSSGALTLSVRGLNELHRFRTEQHTFGWYNQTDLAIATDLGRRPLRRDRPGLGIEVRTTADSKATSEPFVLMDNQYDIVFLMQRARRHGYDVVLNVDSQTGRQYIQFGPTGVTPVVPSYILEWGKSLMSFRPTLSTARQISEVVVRSWDRQANRIIEGKATLQDVYSNGSPERDRVTQIAQAFQNRREIITNLPVRSLAEANSLARDKLRNQFNQMVTASGTTVGLPDLRAGRTIVIAGLGERFNGEYYVTETTHTIGDNGYTTEFSAERALEQPPSAPGGKKA